MYLQILWSLGLDRPLSYFLVLLHNVFAVMYYIFLCVFGCILHMWKKNKLCYYVNYVIMFPYLFFEKVGLTKGPFINTLVGGLGKMEGGPKKF